MASWTQHLPLYAVRIHSHLGAMALSAFPALVPQHHLIPRFGSKPLIASRMLAASGGIVWLAQLGPHTGHAAGVLGPLILARIGLGMVIAPAINTGTFGVAPQDAEVASATVTVGRCLAARSAPPC